MSELGTIWGTLAACAVLIGVAGSELSRSGDIIADKTKLSANWIGLILLGTITSLPELVTAVSSVTAADLPEIAVGEVFGSCLFNLLILVVVDFLYREESVYRRAHVGHVLSAGFGIVLIGIAGLNVSIGPAGGSYAIGWVGPYAPILLGLYLLAVRTVFLYERDNRESYVEGAAERYPSITLRSALVRFSLAGVVVCAAGIWLPFVAADVARIMDWHESFVGSSFVAAITSLPEVVVTVAALRIGAMNMAVANLLGSNLFNVLILVATDLAYLDGPILWRVSAAHGISAISATIMTGLVVVSLLYRPALRIFRTVGWTSLGLLALYLINSYFVFLARG